MDTKQRIEALKELQLLLDNKTISKDEFEVLKAELLTGNSQIIDSQIEDLEDEEIGRPDENELDNVEFDIPDENESVMKNLIMSNLRILLLWI